ncbi:MAG: glycosyltransferase [Leptolyngbya sp. PLA1]|nr:glycosyltransferase [Leptolyngbya sp. PLA1]
MTDVLPGHLGDWDRWADESRGGPAAPAGSGVTAGKRIAMLGWAWPPMQEREGTGYNLVQSETALGLVARGHRVYFLRSGLSYTLRPGMHIRLRDCWRGVACFDLFNSPNVASADRNFLNVRRQVAAPAHTEMVLAWCRAVKAELVHVQSFEGFAFEVVRVLRGAGFPVVVTPHNYYALCPQVDLMHRERRTCDDFAGGERCVGCIPAPDPGTEARRRAFDQTCERMLGHGVGPALRGLPGALKRGLGALRSGRPVIRTPEAVRPSPERAAPLGPERGDDQKRLLRTDTHLVVMNDYGDRRVAGVRALSEASVVLCPGRTLMQVHRAMGVDPRVLRHVPLGLPHVDDITRAREEGGDPVPWSPGAGRPLRVAYMGSVKPNKGLGVLVAALAGLARDLPAPIECEIHAEGGRRLLGGPVASLPWVRWMGRYAPSDVAGIVGACDVGVFPNQGLENCPLVLLEFLAGGRPVLASNLGASADWIKPSDSGWLFDHTSPADLEALLRSLLAGTARIPTRSHVAASAGVPTFDAYMRGVLDAYALACG